MVTDSTRRARARACRCLFLQRETRAPPAHAKRFYAQLVSTLSAACLYYALSAWLFSQGDGRPTAHLARTGGRWPCSSSRVLSCSIQCLQLCDERGRPRLSVSSSSLERETPTSPHLLLLLCSAVFNTFSDLILEQNLLLPLVRNYLPFFSLRNQKHLRFNQIYNKRIVFMLIDKYYILY